MTKDKDFLLLLTEKNSVACSIAKELSYRFKVSFRKVEDGYYVVENLPGFRKDLIIFPLHGHLFEIDDSILPREWRLEELPLFPEKFDYIFRSEESRRKFSKLKALLGNVSGVYIATDPGREGELIARLVLLKAGWSAWERTYRIWTSMALTGDVVYAEMKKRVPAKEFDSLFYSAIARQHSDFLVGVNLTRAMTLLMRKNENSGFNSSRTFTFQEKKEKKEATVWSVGRVQTPVLKLIVERDLLIENFKKVDYFVIKALFKTVDGFQYEGILRKEGVEKEETKYPDKKETVLKDELPGFTEKEATEILNDLKSETIGKIIFFDRKIRKIPPPELFSLTTLQKEASSRFGFSAEKTHELAQNLYLNVKSISYPRTEATGLPDNMIPFVRELLSVFGRTDLVLKVDSSYKHVFNEKKLTDHHAIIPLKTESGYSEGSPEDKLFKLIVRRFIAAFMDPAEFEVYTLKTELGKYIFTTKLRRPVNRSWMSVYYDALLEDEENGSGEEEKEVVSFPDRNLSGEFVFKNRVWKEKRETKPPPRYSDGLLIEKMKRLNLGTPATRDSIIETLILRGYVKRSGRFLISTEKGRKLIFYLEKRKSRLVSPEVTSEWEVKLENIYTKREGKEGYCSFISEVKTFVENELSKIVKSI